MFGTHWHGLFDNDAFRRRWLTDAAAAAAATGSWSPPMSTSRPAAMPNWT
ncbi:hypothetical protein I552_5036 [Mycobacterium xenopi 3993]|nr:hypothetical protein I552_5036 [Mycobacterium xenopi 3993]